MSNQAQYIAILVVYFGLVLYIGYYFSKRVESSKGFFAAKGELGPAVVGFSYSATQISASSYLGVFGTAAVLGYNYIPSAFASAAAAWFAYIIIAERLRTVADRADVYTLPDIFELRFESKFIRAVAAGIIIVGYIPFIVAQLKASANVFEVLLGTSYSFGVLLFGGLIVIYTTLGGAFAVAWSDFIQATIMILGFVILIPVAVNAAGGFATMNANFAAINPDLVTVSGLRPAIWVSCSVITWSFFQIGGAPSAVVRFYMAKDMKTLRKAIAYSLMLAVVIYMARGFLSPAAATLFDLSNIDSDLVIPMLVDHLLPPIVGGIILCAALAAMMSSVDSVLLLCGSAAARDIYQKLINPNIDEKTQLKTARIVTLVIGVIAAVLALNPPASILWLVTFTFSLLASSYTFPLIASFWWPRATKAGGIASMISGAIACIIWYRLGWVYYESWSMWPLGLWPAIVGGFVSLVFLVVVSLMTEKASEEVLDTFYVE
jgi:SSS family transporter